MRLAGHAPGPQIWKAMWSCINASLDVSYFLLALLPFGKLLLCFFLGDAIRFLDLAGKFVALACNHVELAVAERAPLLLQLPFNCFQFPSIWPQLVSVSFKLLEWNIATMQAFDYRDLNLSLESMNTDFSTLAHIGSAQVAEQFERSLIIHHVD